MAASCNLFASAQHFTAVLVIQKQVALRRSRKLTMGRGRAPGKLALAAVAVHQVGGTFFA